MTEDPQMARNAKGKAMNLWGHSFSDFKSCERICWTCGYVIDRNGDEAEVKRWIEEEEGCELHCGGAWHRHKRVPPPHRLR